MPKLRNNQPNWNKRPSKRRRPRVHNGTRRDGSARAGTTSPARAETTRLR